MKLVIVVRTDLNMRKGKMCAQVGHAVEYTCNSERGAEAFDIWQTNDSTKIVVGIDSEQALLDLKHRAQALFIPCHVVIDRGLTEFHGRLTVTCCSFGPAEDCELHTLTGHLKLL